MSLLETLKKKNGWYRSPKKDWELEKYGFYPEGLGDLIFNNLYKIVAEEDHSEWAQKVFDKCVLLLIQGKRWPDEMNPPVVEGKKPYRSQFSMTRDPWFVFYAACIHFDRREYIYLKPPSRLYRPELWELRKALLGKRNCFMFFSKLSSIFPVQDYVKVLDEYALWCYEKR